MCMSNYVFRVLDKNDDCKIDKDEFDFGFEAAMGYAARFIIFKQLKLNTIHHVCLKVWLKKALMHYYILYIVVL